MPKAEVTLEKVDIELTTEQKEAAEKERLRILTMLLKERADLVLKYRTLIKQNGSLLTESMVYAYNKAIGDIFKLITTKGVTDEKPVQKEK